MKRYRSIFIGLVVAAAMITGICHDYLWGPDEPRVAEIARETLVDGHWVTPHLCGLPFLEKPPLYFDLIALAYGISGRITPAVARTVSFFFGCLMLAAVWLFGRYWRGSRAAWLMVLALVTMPRFWRYSHFIIIDIGVGTLGVSALVFLVILLRKHRPAESLYLALAILLCATLIGHSPVLFYLVHNRRSKSCLELAPDVWKIVGRSSLYLYRPDDDIRGSIPFYGKRPTPEINRPEELKKILNSREKVYVIIRPWIYEALLCDPAINRFLQSMEIQPITGPEALPCLVLVSNRTS
jgi:hypothetical protein